MRFSFDWLKRHLKTDKSISEIAAALTRLGLEVDSIVDANDVLRGFVLARVDNVQKHPNADKLRTCTATLADGSKRHIVCGAQNLKNGLTVVLALPGAVIPSSGDVLKCNKIRGITSEGMICSLEELGMAKCSDGILELPGDTDISSSVAEVIGYSSILDISITPNRGDCFCVRGVARDLAAAGCGELIALQQHAIEHLEQFKAKISVGNVFGDMPYAVYRTITGVKNQKSPDWLRPLLQSANIRSVSAVVDFANFLMLDIGCPFHIYDLGKIKGEMQIQHAGSGREFSDLQSNSYELSSDTLIASCGTDVLCVLGIIGSNTCACDENTTDILIECAMFSQPYIFGVGTKYNVQSEARVRFERGIDSEIGSVALDKLTGYILKYCGGCASEVQTFGEKKSNIFEIELRSNKLNSIAGYDIPFETAVRILENLGLQLINKTNDSATFKTPSHRYDLKIEEDLIEEVLRIFSYDSIPCNELRVKFKKNNLILDRVRKITSLKRLACSCGFSELQSFPFIDDESYENFDIHNREGVLVINPVNSEFAIMRNSLLPGILNNIVQSLKLSSRSCNLFEVGNVYNRGLHGEHAMFACARYGFCGERNWAFEDRTVNIFDLKRDLFACLSAFDCDDEKISFDTVNVPKYYHPAKSSAIIYKRNVVGYFGEIRPNLRQAYGISNNVVVGELMLDLLLENSKRKIKTYDKKLFPSVERDFSFVCNSQNIHNIHVNDMLVAIRRVSELIRNIYVFDYYKIDKTSMAVGVSVTIRSNEATLNDDEIKDICSRLVATVEKMGFGLR